MKYPIWFQSGTQIIEQLPKSILNEAFTNGPDEKRLNKFYNYVVKRCEDRRNLSSFSEISQLEIKIWILQRIYGKPIFILSYNYVSICP